MKLGVYVLGDENFHETNVNCAEHKNRYFGLPTVWSYCP